MNTNKAKFRVKENPDSMDMYHSGLTQISFDYLLHILEAPPHCESPYNTNLISPLTSF